jgi:signal transduction histidine kinase
VPTIAKSTPRHFEVHPSVLFRLGEDLISDDVQAITELVKNAYDADADWAVVRIVTTEGPDGFPDDDGYIEIEDNGNGMTVDQITDGWLTLSNSIKREMKAAGQRTGKDRTPLGDKGLGRLGAQRLGHRVTIETIPRGDGEKHSLSFDWRDFEGHNSLSEVDLTIRTGPTKERHGTRIIVSDLREPDELTDHARLQASLGKVISPYHGVEKFQLAVTIDGSDLDIFEFESRVRDAAVIRYTLDFDGTALKVRGRMRLAHLRPNSKKERPEFARTFEADRGEAFLEFLQGLPEADGLHLRPARSSGWWAEFTRTIRLDDVKPAKDGKEIADPGPFTGELDGFNLAPGAVGDLGVFDRLSDLRAHLRDVHGIRIYRDGFNVRVDEDWLGLGKQWSNAPSWYGLRPATTTGYIALSASDNAQLIETTDREGFKRTPHYTNFEKLLREFIATTATVGEVIGRGAVAYRRSLEAPEPNEADTGTLIDRLSATLSQAQGFQGPLNEIRIRLEDDAAETTDLVNRFTSDADELDDDGMEMLSALNALSRHADSALSVVAELETFMGDIAEQKRVGERMQHDLQVMEDQLTLAYETVAVGLTAEALSHEIANIAEVLARRATEITRHVKQVAPNDRKLATFLAHVRGSVTGLRRQLAHLAPSLRYVRERRERIVLSEFVDEVCSYFTDRWRDEKLSIRSEVINDGAVVINRGKIMQVFDNLILNSEYWLKEQVRLGRRDHGEVKILIDGSTVQVSDNGPGVDPEVEHSIFEPFITRKPAGLGRGLGLFISRQLLVAEGCDITLTRERNSRKRRYIFEIDLSGAFQDA